MNTIEKKVINSQHAPGAVGPYSQGIIYGGFIFTSGQLPIIASKGIMPESIEEQTEISLKNIEAVLKEAGSGLENIIKTTVFMTNLEDFGLMNEVYSKFFEDTVLPARSCFQVSKLPKGAKVEIEVIAYK